MARIFIVEDDEQLRGELVSLLMRNGYEVVLARQFGDVVGEVLAASPDLVLLDLTLPVVDGQVICRDLRRKSSVPVIILTSRNNELDELLSISTGADDFIAKPFNPQIFLARIAALLRRVSESTTDALLDCDGVVLDPLKATVAYGAGHAELTKNELHILYLLMRRAGSIVSRADLQDELWQTDEFVDDNTLTVNINRLRATLASIGVPDDFLQTKRGLGYLIERVGTSRTGMRADTPRNGSCK